MAEYFGDREGVSVPDEHTEIGDEYWGGFVALVNRLSGDGSLTESFPLHCLDGGIYGCDHELLGRAIRAEVPGVEFPVAVDAVPDTVPALELAEFLYARVSTAGRKDYHAFPKHEHFAGFDRSGGKAEFEHAVNTLLQRRGLPFEMRGGIVQRVESMLVARALTSTIWRTCDAHLDEMLESAREKFYSKDPALRRDALDELWDAFERVKTLESVDKREGIAKLLDRTAAEPKFRAILEEDAKELTALGNDLMIRHKETDKPPIEDEKHVDYLFTRMFAFLRLVLLRTGRAAVRG